MQVVARMLVIFNHFNSFLLKILLRGASCKTLARKCQVCRFGRRRIGDLAWLLRYCLVFSGSRAVLGHVGQADGGLASQWRQGADVVSGRECAQMIRRINCNAVTQSTPNIRWHITLSAPRTCTLRPPWWSLMAALTRSAVLRSS